MTAIRSAITVPTFARRLGVNADTVHAWIASGELAAVDVSTKPGGRRRWRLLPEAIAAFESGRTSRPAPLRAGRRPWKRPAGFVKFF
jgi:excisionase family DNA binding protein